MMLRKSRGSFGNSFRFVSWRKPQGRNDADIIQVGGIYFTKKFFLRSVVFFFLLLTTVLVSVYTSTTLLDLERHLYESQYDTFSSQALQTAATSAKRTSNGAKATAKHLSNAFPDAAQWPFVAQNGYETNVQSSQVLWDGQETFFMPRVQASQLSQYTQFINTYYPTVESLPANPFGYAVTKFSPDPVTGELVPSLETTGQTFWGSPFNDIFPTHQTSDNSNPTYTQSIGFNVHSLPPYGPAIDVVLNCALSSSAAELEAGSVECGAISDIINLISDITTVVNNAIVQPIYPANNKSTLTGIVFTGLKWTEVLSGVVPTSISGLDFVVHSPTSRIPSITYTIKKGVPVFRGEGDLHDTKYDRYARSRTLSLTDSLSPNSNQYTITMYPRKEFIEIYTTDLPRNSTTGAVLLILLTSIAFIIYDHFMKRDSSEKEDLLQTKRQFVRFISHEVRTPLNAVAMGLALLENEFQQAMDEIDGGEENDEDADDMPGLIDIGEKTTDAAPPETAQMVVSTVEMTGPVNKKKLFLKTFNNKLKIQIEDWKQLAIDIMENTSSAVFVLDDLLNYDKIETGSLRLELKQVDIWELLRKTVHTFELAAKQVKVNLILHMEKDFQGVNETASTEADLADGIELPTSSAMTSGLRSVSSMSAMEEGRHMSVMPEALLQGVDEEEEKSNRVEDCDEEVGMSSRHALYPKHSSKKPISALQNMLLAGNGSVDVLGDGTRLAQLLRNLISNALKFTPEDGRVTVIVKWTADGVPTGAPREVVKHAYDILEPRAGAIRISVTDTGAGLDEDQLSRICSEGVQFNANALQGGRGSGLGLFISKGIVEQHGGTMVVTSEGIGHGSTFTVELPLYLFPPSEPKVIEDSTKSEENDDGPPGSTNEQPRRRSTMISQEVSKDRRLASISGELFSNAFSQVPTRLPTEPSNQRRNSVKSATEVAQFPKRVLIVDDAPSNRKMLIRLLRGKGCVCTEARNGQEALDIFKKTTTYFRNHDFSRSIAAISGGEASHKSILRSSFGEIFKRSGTPTASADGQLIGTGSRSAGGNECEQPAVNDAPDAPPLDDFDAIFMDYEMPILNGPDATKLIREVGCRCIIIGITGNVLPADVKHFIDQGASAVLPKPLQLLDVTRVWHEHLAKNLLTMSEKRRVKR